MYLTKKEVVAELLSRGFEVEERQVIKNGVKLDGICFTNEVKNGANVAPVIYLDLIIRDANAQNMTLDEVVGEIVKLYENNKNAPFNTDEILSKDFILKNITIGMQKTSSENVIKKDSEFEGIECYLLVKGLAPTGDSREIFSMQIRKDILERAGITEEVAWDVAEKNLKKESEILNMSDIIKGLVNDDTVIGLDESEVNMFVISNKCRTKGASAILNKELLKKLADEYDTDKLVVLPSSIHEMIVLPCVRGEENDLLEFSMMVKEVNSFEVEPQERLTDRAYIIEV